jgi:hypothetical protein
MNPWLVGLILDKDYLYYRHFAGVQGKEAPAAAFDVDEPCQILLRYSESMETFGPQWYGELPTMRSKRISWVVRYAVEKTKKF